MQKHNKYLVWTIWVATIAFIGAGFVGWGSYSYGSKASAVGKVGEIEISNAKLNFAYQNLYERYNQLFQGKFDEEQAKKMGLIKQAFGSLTTQAQILNLAKEYGIIVSEKELADYIAGMKAFQENGVFNRSIYNTYLQSRRLKTSTFESILRDELTVQKTLALLEYPAVPFETQTVAAALGVEDKVAYTVVSPDEMNVTATDAELKAAWEENKENYLTPRMYELAVLWSDTSDINTTEAEVQEFYDRNSFNYVSADGAQMSLDQVKPVVTQDLKIKKGKKKALLDYIALKKGNTTPTETRQFPLNDPTLSPETWQEILQSDPGTLLKPKPVGSRYATVKIVKVIEPKPMPYAQAKPAVEAQWKKAKAAEMMETRAQTLLKSIETAPLKTSDFVSLTQPAELAPLDQRESAQFVQKLFTSSEKKGIIRLPKRIVVYKIVEQRMRPVDENVTKTVQNETNQIKKSVFEDALFKKLNERFPVKAYAKGL